MGKLKGVIKKVAKKTAKTAAAVAKDAAVKRIPTPIKQAIQRRAEDKMMEDLEQLQEENNNLREDNQAMAEEIARLKAEAKKVQAIPAPEQAKKWIRGKLPGEKLIKTDPETGEFKEIDRAEWDTLT